MPELFRTLIKFSLQFRLSQKIKMDTNLLQFRELVIEIHSLIHVDCGIIM